MVKTLSPVLCCVAGALKCYLRELPEPLMTFDLYADWLKAAGWVLTSCTVYSRGLGALFYAEIMLCVDVYITIYRVSFLRREKETTDKLEQLRTLLQKLPPENYSNLRCVKPSLYVNVSDMTFIHEPNPPSIHYYILYRHDFIDVKDSITITFLS